ncbi:MAG: superoxide dismutase [Vicinamibacteraceae bacterium]|nr:superoxide dismutase [Vicinamibacteraceae bacterium]
MPTRREVITLGTAALVAASLPHRGEPLHAQSQAAPAGPFTLPPLPYPADALEPHIDAQTMTIHHGRHHQAYVNNLNAAIAKAPSLNGKTIEAILAGLDAVPEAVRTTVRNNGGGHANHSLFWPSLKKGGGAMSETLSKAVASAFGSDAKLKESLTSAAMGVFGSGWAWLSVGADGRLLVESTPNQDSPIMRGHTPLVGIDVWEHAYYLKYQNRRREYVDAILQVIDWTVVGDRLAAAKK